MGSTLPCGVYGGRCLATMAKLKNAVAISKDTVRRLMAQSVGQGPVANQTSKLTADVSKARILALTRPHA